MLPSKIYDEGDSLVFKNEADDIVEGIVIGHQYDGFEIEYIVDANGQEQICHEQDVIEEDRDGF